MCLTNFDEVHRIAAFIRTTSHRMLIAPFPNHKYKHSSPGSIILCSQFFNVPAWSAGEHPHYYKSQPCRTVAAHSLHTDHFMELILIHIKDRLTLCMFTVHFLITCNSYCELHDIKSFRGVISVRNKRE